MNSKNFFSRSSVVTLVILLLLILAGSEQLWAQGSWDTVGTAGFSANYTYYTSLALDSKGAPYVAYMDGGSSYKATVMKFDGSSWDIVGTPGFSLGTADFTSLALDRNDTPYVAYMDGGCSYKATVMKFDGSSWDTVGTPGFSAGEADFTSLALDSSGTPYVAYIDGGSSYKATVMKFDGSKWVTVGAPGFSTGEAAYISFALDRNDTPYVAYTDYAKSNKATVMKFNGTSWITVGTSGFSTSGALYTSLALDGSGTPYVAFEDAAKSNGTTVMKFDGSSWVTVGTAGFSAGRAKYISLTLDGSGTPYVAYQDGKNSSQATVMEFDGSSWVTVGTAGFSTGTAAYTSLALDGSSTLYLAYQDGINSYKATVMKFESSQPPVAVAGTDQTVIVNETVQLNGSGSSDPGSKPLTYSWSFNSKPAGSNAELSSTTVVNPTFVPDVAGDYDVRLVVNNGTADSPPDQVTITALSQQQAITNSIDLVISMNLQHGVSNALTTKLNTAIDLLNSGANANAVNSLNAFINQVNAQLGKKLTVEQADQLLAEAQRIINAINGASLSKQSAQTITETSVPHSYNLAQNYPNPFNPTTQIQFAIPDAGSVTLRIYNSVGQLVRTLVDGNMSAGYHSVTWDATNNLGSKLSSGVYFCRIIAGRFMQVRKMILMK